MLSTQLHENKLVQLNYCKLQQRDKMQRRILTSHRTFTLVALNLLISVASLPPKRSDGSTLPEAPLAYGCRVLFNEINMYGLSGHQFVELRKFCKESPQQTSNKIAIGNFKLVFINHRGLIIATCALNGTKDGNSNWFYTIGSTETVKKDMNIEDCEISTRQVPNQPKRLPQGVDFPIALILLRNKDKNVLKKIQLFNDGTKFRSVMVNKKLERSIIGNMQDMYIIGSSTPFIQCKYFTRYYDHYDVQGINSVIIRDWKNTNGTTDKSNSRCGHDSDESFSLPMQPSFFRYTLPTPGTANICHNASTYNENPHGKRPRLSRDNCYSYLDTQEEENQFFRNPNSFAEQVSLYSQHISNTTQEPESRLSSEAFERLLELESPLMWNNCNRFDQIQYNAMQELPIDLNEVVKTPYCAWLKYDMENSKFKCKFCSRLIRQNILVDRPGRIPDVAKSGAGLLQPKDNESVAAARHYNKMIIEKHQKTDFHKIAESYMVLFDDGMRVSNLSRAFESPGGLFRKYLEPTENIIIAAIMSVRMGLSFRSFKIMSEMLRHFKVNIGFLYQTSHSMAILIKEIGKFMHEDLMDHLRRTLPSLSVVLDCSTDIGGYSTIAILFQTFGKTGKMEVFLYRVIEIHAEDGQSLWQEFLESITNDNIADVIKQKTIGLGTDGAGNLRSVFREQLNNFTDNEIVGVWCQNHRYEICASRAYEKYDYLKIVDVLMNQLCKFLTKKSAKRNQILREVLQEMGIPVFGLKPIRKIRWVSHKYRALLPLINKYDAIIETLERIRSDASHKLQARNEAEYLMDKFKDPMTIASLVFTADVLKEISHVSVQLQNWGKTMIGHKSIRNQLIAFLGGLVHTPGEHVKRLLKKSKIYNPERDEYVDDNNLVLNDFEVYRIKFGSILLNTPNARRANFTIADMKKGFISAIINEIEAYFPPTVVDYFDIFLPMNIPHQENALYYYGVNEILALNKKLKWNYDENRLVDGWLELKVSVVVHVDFDKMCNNKPEEFWPHFLNASNIVWTHELKDVINKVLIVPPTSAVAESIYSIYTYTKDYKRYSLMPSTVEDLIRIKYNGFSDVTLFDTVAISNSFLTHHARSDDSSRRATWKKKNATISEEESDVQRSSELDDNDLEQQVSDYYEDDDFLGTDDDTDN